MTINVILAGPRGRMGSEAIKMIERTNELKLVACIDYKNDGKTLKEVDQEFASDVPVFGKADECFDNIKADVFVDLTIPETGYIHTKSAIEHHIRPVIGTTGFTSEQISELTEMTKNQKLGGIIAPNFAIGAVLMMQFAKMAGKYFTDVEIIEKHHDRKLDAPSGTAVKTAELIRESRNYKKQGHPEEKETIQGARGADFDGMRIHSLRLPGLVAHQEVIFGGAGQTLTIQHDSLNRESFMDGIRFSIEQVMDLNQLVYGLENIL
jgi:4-hydroxy-tetrahydrodipicolinate reductase